LFVTDEKVHSFSRVFNIETIAHKSHQTEQKCYHTENVIGYMYRRKHTLLVKKYKNYKQNS